MIKEINMAVIAVDVQDAASVIRILSLIGRIFLFLYLVRCCNIFCVEGKFMVRYKINNYESKLDILETQKAIKLVKDTFERELAKQLSLTRVSAPLFVKKSSGLNDNLNGVERPVSFDIKNIDNEEIEVVQSLAKWKRMALKKYGIKRFKGLYTDMNAIRRDEDLDNLHSCYVDQWDWEKVIYKEDRNLDFLKGTVKRIMNAIVETEYAVYKKYPNIEPSIQANPYFVTTEELEVMYPSLTPKQREKEITRLHKTVFIMKIGKPLANGKPHDGRSPDYDDWELNGDLLVWYDLFDDAVELSSMGIRVDAHSLQRQLIVAGCEDRMNLPFHKALLNNELPLTMGGGIGQSRLCLVMLKKAHVGEVQASIWPDDLIEECVSQNIYLL